MTFKTIFAQAMAHQKKSQAQPKSERKSLCPRKFPDPPLTPQRKDPSLIFRLASLTFSVRPLCHGRWMMSLLESVEMNLFQFCRFDLVLQTRHQLNRHICHPHSLFSWAHLTGKKGKRINTRLGMQTY